MNSRNPNHTNHQPRFACLDLCDFRWSPTLAADAEGSEFAILSEIWHSGGLFQTSNAVPEDSTVTILTGGGPVNGKVASCQRDEYGFLVEVRVVEPRNWFPRAYQPAYLLGRTSLAA